MRFLLDSCISFFAVKDLRENEFKVIWVPETGKDPGDEVIIKKAYIEKLVLVTADKDFGELVFLTKKRARREHPPTPWLGNKKLFIRFA